jgi:5-methylcytosine-specific restriction protein A
MTRLYSLSKWHKMRAYQLAQFPLCAFCDKQGIITAATIVDHIKPHKGHINLFFDSKNLQSLCKHCHDSHKQRQEKSGYLAGSGIDGLPLDPLSHWYK